VGREQGKGGERKGGEAKGRKRKEKEGRGGREGDPCVSKFSLE